MNPFIDQAKAFHQPKEPKTARQPMVLHGLEKKQAEKAKQLKHYREWKAQVRDGIARGDYGDEIIELFKVLRRPGLAVAEYVQQATWLLSCTLDVRLTLLSYIDHAMTRQNIRSGLPTFNDALPWEPPTPFLLIRHYLTGV